MKLILDISHTHIHNLPCHPTKSYIEQQASIDQTDREQQSDSEIATSQNSIHIAQVPANADFKTIQSRPKMNETNLSKKISIKPKIFKPTHELSQQQIYNADVLQQYFQQSTKPVPLNIRALIMQKQKFIEDKVYIGFNDTQANILQLMYEDYDTGSIYKEKLKENLQKMMAAIHDTLYQEIEEGDEYKIQKIVRGQFQPKDLKIKRKISNFTTNSINSSTGNNTGSNIIAHTLEKRLLGMHNRSQSNPGAMDESGSFNSGSYRQIQSPLVPQHDFSLKSQRTKKAQEFIRKIQKQQEDMRKRRRQEEQKKKTMEVRSLQEKRQFEEEIKNERKNYLKKRMQAKKKIKERELQIRDKANKEYKQFLKKYKAKVPLFKQKEIKFQQVQQQERQKEVSMLQKRKQQLKPINLEEIKQHEKKYQSQKKQKESQRQKQRKIKSLQKPEGLEIKYYVSKIHSILVEQQKKQKEKEEIENPKLLRSELIRKRNQYSLSVRKNYMPKGVQAKRKQLQQLLQKLQWSQRGRTAQLDMKQRNLLGNKYLHRIHQLIEQLRASNKLPPLNKTIDQSQLEREPRYKNYLRELDTESSKRRHSIDFEITQHNPKDADFKARKLQQKAKRRQVYLSGGSLDFDKFLDQTKQMDQQYLESAKVKVALLNKYRKRE